MRQLLLLASFMVVSAGSFAASNITYTCALDGAERLIEVVYLESGQELPCEVRYSKEGETQVLWTYANEIGQCEAKAAARWCDPGVDCQDTGRDRVGRWRDPEGSWTRSR